MREVDAYEAKNHLSRLLEEVEAGETITITRHGLPVARLVPIQSEKRTPAEVIDAIKAFGKAHRLEGMSVKDLITEGRKYSVVDRTAGIFRTRRKPLTAGQLRRAAEKAIADTGERNTGSTPRTDSP
jgi:prevent-host-death family protein